MDEFNSKSATTEERISELKIRSEENIQNKVGGGVLENKGGNKFNTKYN